MNNKIRCNVLVFNNFYENPDEVREIALAAHYNECHLPRFHTKSYATVTILHKIENLLFPFTGKISNFYLPNNIASFGDPYNGSFQYGYSLKKPWIHIDHNITKWTTRENTWAGVLYLTPNPPTNTGTILYENKLNKDDTELEFIERSDIDNWIVHTKVENIYNRIVFYRVYQFHAAETYFGTDVNNSRLFQVFFFSTDF